jgi:hypothetical protein
MVFGREVLCGPEALIDQTAEAIVRVTAAGALLARSPVNPGRHAMLHRRVV